MCVSRVSLVDLASFLYYVLINHLHPVSSAALPANLVCESIPPLTPRTARLAGHTEGTPLPSGLMGSQATIDVHPAIKLLSGLPLGRPTRSEAESGAGRFMIEKAPGQRHR